MPKSEDNQEGVRPKVTDIVTQYTGSSSRPSEALSNDVSHLRIIALGVDENGQPCVAKVLFVGEDFSEEAFQRDRRMRGLESVLRRLNLEGQLEKLLQARAKKRSCGGNCQCRSKSD